MSLKNYRICVDGQFYTGEKEVTLNTWTSDAWSGNTFQTKRVDRNVLTFEPKENNNFKVITGTINLIGEINKIIKFISMTGLLSGNEITIEAEPYKIPLELNIDYFLGLESDVSRLKAINVEMKKQLDIATELGEKRFIRLTELENENEELLHDKETLMAYDMGNKDLRLCVIDLCVNYYSKKIVETLSKLMYWMDKAREGQEIDLDKFNKVWKECEEVVNHG